MPCYAWPGADTTVGQPGDEATLRHREPLVPLSPSSPAQDGDRLITVKDLAAMLGLKHRTIHNWRVRGYGPPAAVVLPRRVLFRQADVEAWMAAPPDPLAARRETAQQ